MNTLTCIKLSIDPPASIQVLQTMQAQILAFGLQMMHAVAAAAIGPMLQVHSRPGKKQRLGSVKAY